jgi:hypothetical protein
VSHCEANIADPYDNVTILVEIIRKTNTKSAAKLRSRKSSKKAGKVPEQYSTASNVVAFPRRTKPRYKIDVVSDVLDGMILFEACVPCGGVRTLDATSAGATHNTWSGLTLRESGHRVEAGTLARWLLRMPRRAPGESTERFARGPATLGPGRETALSGVPCGASQACNRANAFPACRARRITLRFTIRRSRERNRCARLPVRG